MEIKAWGSTNQSSKDDFDKKVRDGDADTVAKVDENLEQFFLNSENSVFENQEYFASQQVESQDQDSKNLISDEKLKRTITLKYGSYFEVKCILAFILDNCKSITNKKAFAYSLAKIAKNPNCESYRKLKEILSSNVDLKLWKIYLEEKFENNNISTEAKKIFFYELFFRLLFYY